MGKQSFDAVYNLHMHWYNYAIKALIGEMAKQLLNHLQPNERQLLAKCLRKVSEKSSVRKGAKCLIEARDRAKANRFYEGCNDPKTGYILCDTYEKSFITVDDNIDVGTHRKPTKREVSELIRTAIHGDKIKEVGNWATTYKKLLEFKKSIGATKKSDAAKVYQKRLYDIVFEKDLPDRQDHEKSSAPDYLLSPFSAVDNIKKKFKKTTTSFKFLSPRFAPIMPDKIDTASRILSPSIFSFYEDNSPDNIASIPKIMNKFGMEEQDQEAVLDVVMDISGTKKTVDISLDMLKKANNLGINDKISEATSKLSKAFKDLETSFSNRQKSDIDNNGFAFLEPNQLNTLIKKHGIKNPIDVGFDMNDYANQSEKQRHVSLWKSIEYFAGNKNQTRQKRQISVLAPIILSPYMFAPIFGLTVLGPVVLSPNIFSPLILNPAALSPFIMSPAIFMPFILSPYVLTPYILTPLLAAPFVLSPYCLSPNILNPYLLSPLILSPYVLSPDILSPQALGGSILSPNAFSPAILTESAIMASVLSPSFMS
ncbi:unnamed protein product [Enterobius vermicularis]|uniref:ANK_REP_REGION domain-containing protein n=1 Tax=Enterobius vermicularis TaxID=51028 RepID=A0A0N4VMW3_ENTVE|nr:unnamed protein product [Enterobius vermicularis]